MYFKVLYHDLCQHLGEVLKEMCPSRWVHSAKNSDPKNVIEEKCQVS